MHQIFHAITRQEIWFERTEIDTCKLRLRCRLEALNNSKSSFCLDDLICDYDAIRVERPFNHSSTIPFGRIRILGDVFANGDIDLRCGLFRCIGQDSFHHLITVFALETFGIDHDSKCLPDPLRDRARNMHRREIRCNCICYGFVKKLQDNIFDGSTFENRLTTSIEISALNFHWFVVIQDALTHLKVSFFNFALSLLDCTREHWRFDRIAFFHSHSTEHVECCSSCEHLHQIIVKCEIETRLPLITLPTRTASKLVVNSATLVSFRSDNMQSAEFIDGWEEFQAVNAPSSLIEFRFQSCIRHRLDLLRWQITRFGDPVLQ